MSSVPIHEIALEAGSPEDASGELLILALGQDRPGLPPEGAALLGEAAGPVGAFLASGDFHAEVGETTLFYAPGARFPRVLLLGVGSTAELTRDRMRGASASAVRRARDLGIKTAVFLLPAGEGIPVPPPERLELAVEGALLGTYQFREHKTLEPEKVRSLDRLAFRLPAGLKEGEAREALRRGNTRADGVCFARDLANEPSNSLTPTRLAERAEAMAKEAGLESQVMDAEACRREGMGAFLSVAQGSEEPPQFIVLRYEGKNRKAPLLALVGKGLTFDAGGICLKPAPKMDEMKFDMCGAAAVLGVMKCLPALGLPVRVIAAIPATENMPSGKATRPGDVVRSLVGKTIEVINTDAEGRLVLADALGWVIRRHQPAAVIDLATLTGAVFIALGYVGAAVLASDDLLAARIQAASERSGERTWRLPLWEEFQEHVKGETGDLRNVGEARVGGGTIFGGMFLRQFVGDTPWAHIDIAGTAWWDKDRPFIPKGPSGFGVRLLLDLLEGYAK